MRTIRGAETWSDQALSAHTLDALIANIAVLDAAGTIVAVNDAWVRFAGANALELEDSGLGVNYLALCEGLAHNDAPVVAAGLRGLLADAPGPFRHEYEMPSQQGRIWVKLSAVRVGKPEAPYLILFHEDISIQRHAQAVLGRMTAALLHAEEDERRRIARELHDGVAQYLTGAKLLLAGLRTDEKGEAGRTEIANLLAQAMDEIRGLSYVLHPPVLRDHGLPVALREFASGFARRAGIQLKIDIQEDFPRQSQATEVALYRVAQEALANVHRHSGSVTATLTLRTAGEMVLLAVRDHGVGFNKESPELGGVGLAGMRLRLEFLNGHINLVDAEPGLRLEAWTPLLPPAET